MLKEKLKELVSACFSGIWVESYEFQEAITEIAELCRDEQWKLATWDVSRGISINNSDAVRFEFSDCLRRQPCTANSWAVA